LYLPNEEKICYIDDVCIACFLREKGRNMTTIKKTTLTAICVSLCVVLPMAFHVIPDAGSIFCPMHIPVLICGLVCGWEYGILCGTLGPVLSCILTGMPPMAYLPPMMIELAAYGMITGVLFRVIKSGRIYVDLYVSLAIAMVVGRVIAGIAKALIFAPGEITVAVWATTHFVIAFPGIIIQLMFVPNIIFGLMRAHVIPARYPRQKESAIAGRVTNG